MASQQLRFTFLLLLGLGTLLTTSCSTAPTSSTTGSSSSLGYIPPAGPRLNKNHPALVARNSKIAAEPRGGYYIGRRFWLEGTRFWGFIRKPGQSWDQARLVVMNENVKKSPDRLPEGGSGKRHGYDHNYEYRLHGTFTGGVIYDPNSNQKLPEFQLRDYQLISANPGFLFHPQQKFEKNRVPAPPRY